MDAILEVGWLLLAILTPLWVNLWSAQPFDPAKALLVRVVVWLMAGLALADALLVPSRRTPPIRRSGTRAFVLAVLVLAAVIVAATLFSVDRRLSLWGSYDRTQGALTLLSVLALAAMVSARMRDRAQARRLVTAMVATGVPLVAFGAVQALGWQPLPLITDARSPVYATLGRSNFLGAYLALLLPLTLALLVTVPRRSQRWLLAVLGVAEGGVLILTRARSAWLAAIVSLAVFGWLWWRRRIPARWWRAGWAGIGLAAVSGPLLVFWLGRAEQGSPAARRAIWRATWSLVQQRPWLGYGPDALGLVFPRVFPPALVYYQGRDFFVDRAHNLLLDWAVTTGILGLVAYLAILGVFVLVVARDLPRALHPERRALLIGALAAVAGQFVNNLVSFDVTPTATAAWLLVGMAVALAGQGDGEAVVQAVRARHTWRWLAAGIGFLLALTLNVRFNVCPLLADVAARTADRYAAQGAWARAVDAGERAVRYWPQQPVYHVSLSRWTWQMALAQRDAPWAWWQRTEEALFTATRLSPDDFAIWSALGAFYALSHREFGTDLALAHRAYARAVTLAPNHATVYDAWGQVYLWEGDAEMAAPLLRQAVILDASSAVAYVHLGAAELALGRLPEALADYREAVRLAPGAASAYTGLARSYRALGRTAEARNALARALMLAPTNADALALRDQMGVAP